MELLRVKLNRIWGICQIEAGCTGITVIPPWNLRISNLDGCPKVDVVRVRLVVWRNTSIKDDRSTLNDTGLIRAFIGYGRAPNATAVELGAPNWCIDRTATCLWGQKERKKEKRADFQVVSSVLKEVNTTIHNGQKVRSKTFVSGTPISAVMSYSNLPMRGTSCETGLSKTKYACTGAGKKEKDTWVYVAGRL